VRLTPETTVVEGADALAAAAGNTNCRNCLCSLGLPGTSAHIESLGTSTEQERLRIVDCGFRIGLCRLVHAVAEHIRSSIRSSSELCPYRLLGSKVHNSIIRNRSLKAISEWSKRYRHAPLKWQHAKLSLKLRGHYNYYGVRGNYLALSAFWHKIQRLWLKALIGRSQKVCKRRLFCIGSR